MSSDFLKAAQLGAGRVKEYTQANWLLVQFFFMRPPSVIVLAEGAQWGSPACPLALWSVACVVSEHRGLELFPERRSTNTGPGPGPFPAPATKRSQQPEMAGQRVAASARACAPAGAVFSLGLSCGVGRGLQPLPGDPGCYSREVETSHHGTRLRLEEARLGRSQRAGLV